MCEKKINIVQHRDNCFKQTEEVRTFYLIKLHARLDTLNNNNLTTAS